MREQNSIKVAHGCLVKTTLQAEEKTVFKTSPEMKKRPSVAWWNKECEREERIVRSEYKKHRTDPINTTNLKSFQQRRAIKHRVFRKTTLFFYLSHFWLSFA